MITLVPCNSYLLEFQGSEQSQAASLCEASQSMCLTLQADQYKYKSAGNVISMEHINELYAAKTHLFRIFVVVISTEGLVGRVG